MLHRCLPILIVSFAILAMTGPEFFNDSGQALGGAINTNGAAFGDIDGDWDQDLVLCQVGNDSILKNNGSGVFTTFATINAGAADVVLADLDKDGDLDAVYIESNGVEVFTNDGVGNFSVTPTQSLSAGLMNKELDTGDLNGDGFVDVIIGAATSISSAPE